MNELEIIRAQRPELSGPTETERAMAKERFMQDITDSEPGPSVPDDELEVRRARRRWSVAAVVAVVVVAAASIVVVNGVLTFSSSSGPLSPPPAAAAELHRLADLTGSTVGPAEPYSVQTRIAGGIITSTGAKGPSLSPYDSTTYVLGDGNYVTLQESCRQDSGSTTTSTANANASWPGHTKSIEQCGSGPFYGEDPALANAPTITEVHTILDQHVDGYLAERPGLSRAAATLQVAVQGLRSSAAKPDVRAELLRLVADTPGIHVETGVTTQLGAAGSRFSTPAGPSGSIDVVLDPADGYVLESHSVSPMPFDVSGTTIGSGSDGSPRESLEETSSYGRPQPVDVLPVDVSRARDAVVANTPTMESDPGFRPLPAGTPVCSAATFYYTDHTFLPPSIWPLHCWTTGS